MSPYVGLFFNLIILAALGVTIFYAFRLSKQFDNMQADRKVFETLITALNLASAKAEASIRSFKENATGSGDILQDRITTARGLADELEIIIQAGDSLADRLQGLAEKGRAAAPAAEPKQAEAPAKLASPGGAEPRTKAERELLEAIRAKQQS